MAFQYDQVFIKPDDDGAIIQCMCGMGHHHGQVEVYVSPGVRESKEEWWGAWTAYFQVRMRPWHGRWQRVKAAWRVLRGEWWEADFEMSAIQGHLFADWLKRKASEAWDQRSDAPIEWHDASLSAPEQSQPGGTLHPSRKEESLEEKKNDD